MAADFLQVGVSANSGVAKDGEEMQNMFSHSPGR
jgi:hypothetical protein